MTCTCCATPNPAPRLTTHPENTKRPIVLAVGNLPAAGVSPVENGKDVEEVQANEVITGSPPTQEQIQNNHEDLEPEAVAAAAALFFFLKDGAAQANLIELPVVAVYTGVISVCMGVATEKLDDHFGWQHVKLLLCSHDYFSARPPGPSPSSQPWLSFSIR